ncbi:hypothetical protein CTTA_5182 [Comamonas testosteroni]|uniref:Uncharacterized protein n=1 Tax=Comamonas testosteroni TaxID=285 RepID=A0A5A7MK35_COMTE|nr:hypothetical protein [Comamonas testosteroni]GEQ78177.1 hypothetical protein CTTA_5182 [Comamonas testosteroni]
MWVQLAIFVASVIISYATRPKAATPKPAAFEDFDFPQSTEGTAQVFVFGDVWIEDWMVVGVGNYRTSPIRR